MREGIAEGAAVFRRRHLRGVLCALTGAGLWGFSGACAQFLLANYDITPSFITAVRMLGAEQSGNMSAVGFDLFAQMLNQAVSATREGDLKAMDALPPALSDITVNVPGHTYLPEEYVPDADERVLWYRRIASAATEQAVEDVRADLADKRPDMPQAAKNLLEKARIKAYANEHHIKTVSVTAGKLVVEPIDVPRDKMTGLRRAGGRYLADKRKLSLPLRYFKLDEGDNLLAPVAEFLEELAK